MAVETQQVLIEFETDTAQLDTALSVLEKTGKIDKDAASQLKQTNAELAKRSKLINQVGKDTAKTADATMISVEEMETALTAFFSEFTAQLEDELRKGLQDAGFEFDEFGKIVDKNNKKSKDSTDSLKGKLSELTKQLQVLKLEGKDNTEQYRQMVIEAGNIRDAIGDVNSEVNNAAANSQKLEGMIQIAQGIAAGFAVAQGAAGIFGEAGEDLNETLVNVTSSMAILQGINEIYNLTQKETAASTLINTVFQKAYNVVVGESIGLMAALRIAMAATGIGLLIAGLIYLATQLKKTNKELDNANAALERNKTIIEADTAAIVRLSEAEEARASAANAMESEIIRIRGRGLQAQKKAIEEANALLITQRDALDKTSEAYFKLNAQVEANNTAIEEIDNKVILEKINLDKQLRSEQLQSIADGIDAQLAGAKKNSQNELNLAKQSAAAKKEIELNEAGDNLAARLKIEADYQKQLRDLDRAYAQIRQQDKIAAAENELLEIQQHNRSVNDRINQEEVDAQKKVIRENARLELLQEGLTENQKLKIRKDSLNAQLQLQKDFDKQTSIDAINDEISRNNAALTNIKLTEQEKFDIQADNLVAAAQIEIEENKGLTDKIKEIRKKLQEDLRNLRLQFLEKQLSDELSLEQSRTGVLRRANERIAADESKSLSKRIAAINQLAVLDIAAINKKEDALKQQLKEELISQQEYNVKYEELKDQEAQIAEETELKKRLLAKQTQKQNILLALDTATQVLGIIQQFGQQQTDAEQIRIDSQRKEIDDLKEAGAITEKEALARQKKLDQEERALKRKQAERDKSIAIFQAVINTAAAVAKALPNLVLAGIAAALGAAQIALIASRPIPKFARGKKDSYEGLGLMGEAGAELMESNGNLYLATKPTTVWVGKRDKIYNPTETAAMFEKNNLNPYIIKDDQSKEYKSIYNYGIDYKKLGSVIAENIPRAGLNVDQNGFTEWVHGKNSFTKYLDSRRGYK